MLHYPITNILYIQEFFIKAFVKFLIKDELQAFLAHRVFFYHYISMFKNILLVLNNFQVLLKSK